MTDPQKQDQMSGADTSDGLDFSAAQGELEQVIRKLEGDDVALEDSLKLYEEGIRLVKQLQAKLSAAEQKVEVLMGEIKPESSDATDSTLS